MDWPSRSTVNDTDKASYTNKYNDNFFLDSDNDSDNPVEAIVSRQQRCKTLEPKGTLLSVKSQPLSESRGGDYVPLDVEDLTCIDDSSIQSSKGLPLQNTDIQPFGVDESMLERKMPAVAYQMTPTKEGLKFATARRTYERPSAPAVARNEMSNYRNASIASAQVEINDNGFSADFLPRSVASTILTNIQGTAVETVAKVPSETIVKGALGPDITPDQLLGVVTNIPSVLALSPTDNIIVTRPDEVATILVPEASIASLETPNFSLPADSLVKEIWICRENEETCVFGDIKDRPFSSMATIDDKKSFLNLTAAYLSSIGLNDDDLRAIDTIWKSEYKIGNFKPAVTMLSINGIKQFKAPIIVPDIIDLERRYSQRQKQRLNTAADDKPRKKRKPVRTSVRVGQNFQAVIPQIEENYKPNFDIGEKIWDPNMAYSSPEGSQLDEIIIGKELNVKMALLECLHSNNYDTSEAIGEILDLYKSNPWFSFFKDEQKSSQIMKYLSTMWKKGKYLRKACKDLNCPPAMILNHYYRWKGKNRSAYVASKSENKKESDECEVCHDGGHLIICESCRKAFHLRCLDPPLTSVPEGEWYCFPCVQRSPAKLRRIPTYGMSSFEGQNVKKPELSTTENTKKPALLAVDDKKLPASLTTDYKKSSALSTVGGTSQPDRPLSTSPTKIVTRMDLMSFHKELSSAYIARHPSYKGEKIQALDLAVGKATGNKQAFPTTNYAKTNTSDRGKSSCHPIDLTDGLDETPIKKLVVNRDDMQFADESDSCEDASLDQNVSSDKKNSDDSSFCVSNGENSDDDVLLIDDDRELKADSIKPTVNKKGNSFPTTSVVETVPHQVRPQGLFSKPVRLPTGAPTNQTFPNTPIASKGGISFNTLQFQPLSNPNVSIHNQHGTKMQRNLPGEKLAPVQDKSTNTHSQVFPSNQKGGDHQQWHPTTRPCVSLANQHADLVQLKPQNSAFSPMSRNIGKNTLQQLQRHYGLEHSQQQHQQSHQMLQQQNLQQYQQSHQMLYQQNQQQHRQSHQMQTQQNQQQYQPSQQILHQQNQQQNQQQHQQNQQQHQQNQQHDNNAKDKMSLSWSQHHHKQQFNQNSNVPFDKTIQQPSYPIQPANKQSAQLDAPKAKRTFVSKSFDLYIVSIPRSAEGLLIKIAFDEQNRIVFQDYRRKEDGSKGPAEIANAFVSSGDIILSIDDFSCKGWDVAAFKKYTVENASKPYHFLKVQTNTAIDNSLKYEG